MTKIILYHIYRKNPQDSRSNSKKKNDYGEVVPDIKK